MPNLLKSKKFLGRGFVEKFFDKNCHSQELDLEYRMAPSYTMCTRDHNDFLFLQTLIGQVPSVFFLSYA